MAKFSEKRHTSDSMNMSYKVLLTVKSLGFLRSEADLTSRNKSKKLTSRYKSGPVVIKVHQSYRKVDQSLYPLIMQISLLTRTVICLNY